jgi:hypothetical protein
MDFISIIVLDSYESSEFVRFPTGPFKKESIGYTSDGYIPVVAGLLRRGGGQILILLSKVSLYSYGSIKFPCLAWIPTDPEAINIRALKKYNIWPYSLNFTLLLFLKVIPTININ